MKKFNLLLVVIISILLISTSFAASKFPDVAGTKYEKAVDELVSSGVINGFDDNTFKPNNNVTRAQLAKMLVEALKMNALDNKALSNFSDVSDTHWAYSYIKRAVDNKLIAGYEDGTFKPDNNVTYAESMAMLLRAMKQEEKMTDKTWPTGYINEAKKVGLLKDVTFTDPNVPANRGDTAISLFNMLNILNGKQETTPKTENVGWNGNYINNIDGYMNLTLKDNGDNTFDFSFAGYKNGGFKGGNNTADIIDGKGVFSFDFNDNHDKLLFSHEGNNIVVTSEGDYDVFAGIYKVDDGSITEVVYSNPNRISATYTNGTYEIALEENGEKMNMTITSAVKSKFIYIGKELYYSNGVATVDEEAFGEHKTIKITIGTDKINIEASSTDTDDTINEISGEYNLKSKNSTTLKDLKDKTKGYSVGKGVFMY